MSDRRKRLFKRPQEADGVPRDVDEEVRFHIEKKVERLSADGMTEDEARREALHKFGNVEGVKAAMAREQRAGLTGQLQGVSWSGCCGSPVQNRNANSM